MFHLFYCLNATLWPLWLMTFRLHAMTLTLQDIKTGGHDLETDLDLVGGGV